VSQDIRREREGVAWPDAKDAKAAIDAERWKNIAYNENERAGRIQQDLDAANAKLAEANDALEQAGRSDPCVQRVLDWLDRKEATIRDRVNFAIGPADRGFSDLGAIESRAAKLRHAQHDSKLLGELRGILAPTTWHDEAAAVYRQQTRYWRVAFVSAVEWLRSYDDEIQYWSDSHGDWSHAWSHNTVHDLERDGKACEITAAELPEGVTP